MAQAKRKPTQDTASKKNVNSARSIGALAFWHDVNVNVLAQLPYELSPRQTVILLHVYLTDSNLSIKDLSEALAISKPAICRGIDTLEEAGLVKRGPDKTDRRNIIVKRTVKGSSFLGNFANIILTHSKG